jgi:ribosomal protein L37E
MTSQRTVPQAPRPPRREEGLDCEICGNRMYERSCKIICRNCGFTRDCSDP